MISRSDKTQHNATLHIGVIRNTIFIYLDVAVGFFLERIERGSADFSM